MGVSSGLAMVLSFVAIVACVFFSVLGIVSVVKIIQIAEDLRYIRSKSDLKVNRPKSWKNTVMVCVIVSVIIVFLLMGFMITAGMYLQVPSK